MKSISHTAEGGGGDTCRASALPQPPAGRGRTKAPALGRLFIAALALFAVGASVPASATIGKGSLAAPCPEPCSPGYLNNTHWKVRPGTSIIGKITGATDVTGSTVPVTIQSSLFGNTTVNGTLSSGTITFYWTVPSDHVCSTTIVSYGKNGYNANNKGIGAGTGNSAAGFAIVDSSCNVIQPNTITGRCYPPISFTCPSGATTVCSGTSVDVFDTVAGQGVLDLSGITGGTAPYYVKVDVGTGTCGSFTVTSTPVNTCLLATCTSYSVTPTVGTYAYRVTVTDSSTPTLSACCVVMVTVNAPATVSAGGPQTVCASSPTVTLNGSVGGSATSGTWSGGGGTFNPNNTTLNATYTPTAAEITAGTVTLTLTTNDPAGPCPAVSDTMTITINPLPTVSINPVDPVCLTASPITLSGSPLGGTFSGDGVTGNQFDPGLAGLGDHVITYTYTDGNGCTNSAPTTITVKSCSMGCTLTQGYWKNHPKAWPVTSLMLGQVSYTEAQLLTILNTPDNGDGLIILAKQLIAAKLNVANGASAPGSCGIYTNPISDADTLIGTLVVGTDTLDSSVTSALATCLDNYNMGVTGPGHCQ